MNYEQPNKLGSGKEEKEFDSIDAVQIRDGKIVLVMLRYMGNVPVHCDVPFPEGYECVHFIEDEGYLRAYEKGGKNIKHFFDDRQWKEAETLGCRNK